MISAGAEVAGAGISEYITGLKTAKATEQATNFAYQKAVASADFTGSLEEFKRQAGELTGEQYGEVLEIESPTDKIIGKIDELEKEYGKKKIANLLKKTVGSTIPTGLEGGDLDLQKGEKEFRVPTLQEAIEMGLDLDEFEYQLGIKPEKPTDPKVSKVTEEYDDIGNKTITEYDKEGNVLKIKTVEAKPEKPKDPPRNIIKQLTSMHNQKAPPEKFIQFFKTTEMTDEELTAYRTMYNQSVSREQQKNASQRNLQNTYASIGRVSTNPSKTQKVAELIKRLSKGEKVTGELSNALYDLIDSANLPTGVTLYVNDEKIDLEIGTITGNKRSQVYKGFMRDILKAINKGAEFLTPAEQFLEDYPEE